MIEGLHNLVIERPRSALREFLRTESAGGIVLMAAAAAALLVANSPFSDTYFGALKSYVGPLTLSYWINDGLMAIFFLLVGLEVKRELLDGQLSTWERRILPGAAAAGGMIVPALIFAAFNIGDADTIRGWAIPSATDIAFALGVLTLLGPRVPVSLKVFLTAVAIIDDLGAIVIIALFYTADLNLAALVAAIALIALLYGFNRLGIRSLWPYLIIGAGVWVAMLLSGVHATLAGVAVALTIPLTPAPGHVDDEHSPLHRLEHAIAGWVAFAIVPIFGFANAGLSFTNVTAEMLVSPIVLGIALGLFVGKQIGVFGVIWLMKVLRLADYPVHASGAQVYGVALLCGIGFTMSLFIGGLSYASDIYLDEVKLGVLGGSLLSGIIGAVVLSIARREPAS
ncbi:Na+/H+ antiporter NhaA [Sphingosinicella microcystinivorans]|uniref:Na(+)/H(+) antiporter NhaA n=1 Tax=Sphingosinicella microcystinivorans TaxID=335406 RepID=A0AAD1D5M3_SPHMI|nr:Na+/H+ antiporter NhaA [Sphingosinicella microcystinivorans]RKS91129.1 sodium/proton antiporter (NhaA family) [Sphingosinicella microcystinivorans]BBE34050.1 Na(+)/H(+) antiporter NhaA [Sphingosinicella microcystinivorans]